MARLLFQLIGTLLLVAWVMHFLPYLIGAGLVIFIVLAVYKAIRELQDEDAAGRARIRAIRKRADEQHNATMSGDVERGMFGNFPPAKV
jgi:hypothetical protein